MRTQRWAPLTGVAFIVPIVIGGIIAGDPPEASSPVQEIVNHYQDNKTSVEVGAGLGALAALLLVFFGAYLRTVLSAAEGRGGTLSALALVGTAIVAVGGAFDSTITIAIAEAADDIDPVAAQALQALWDNNFIPFILGTQVFLISVGLSVVRYRALPRWLGWVALVFAVVGFTPVGFIAALGAAAWILVVSVILTVRAGPEGGVPGAAGHQA